jgi:hypothetical protein
MPAYQRQVEAFRRKFGRKMSPADPFFFDPNADTPQFRPPDELQHALDWLAELMADAGLPAEIIFAFKRTGGLFHSAETPLPRDQKREWDAAIREYHGLLARSREQ